MSEFITYGIKAGICLAAFLIVYKLLLSRETFHRLNRAVLLCGVALSFIIPLGLVTLPGVNTLPETRPLLTANPYLTAAPQTPAVTANDAPMAANNMAASEIPERRLSFAEIAGIIFLAGMAAALSVSTASIIKVIHIIRSGKRTRLDRRTILVLTETDTMPFSWFRYIVISRSDYAKYGDAIITHEKAHIRLRHSADLMFLEIVGWLQWFNPAVWFIKRKLHDIHEYEADAAVLDSGIDRREYQLLLIKKAVGAGRYFIADSLNHSKLKNRITMMTKRKSGYAARMKVLVMLPLAAAGLVAFAGSGHRPDNGKDNKKVVEIAIYTAQLELPDGNTLIKALTVETTDDIPKYLAVDLIIDDPATSFWAGIGKEKSLKMYISPVNKKESSPNTNRFYVDVRDLTKVAPLLISDFTNLMDYAPESYQAMIPSEFRESEMDIPITVRITDGKFELKANVPESPVQIEGMRVNYNETVFQIFNIDVDRNGITSVDGKTFTLNQLSDKIKTTHQKAMSENLYLTFLNADAKTRWGDIRNIKDSLWNQGIYNISDNNIPKGGINLEIECTEEVPFPSIVTLGNSEVGYSMPYYMGYGYADEKTAKQHLIEIYIKGHDILVNNEKVSLKDVEAKINKISADAGATDADMIFGVRPDDNAEMGVIQSIKATAAKQRPRALITVIQTPEQRLSSQGMFQMISEAE